MGNLLDECRKHRQYERAEDGRWDVEDFPAARRKAASHLINVRDMLAAQANQASADDVNSLLAANFVKQLIEWCSNARTKQDVLDDMLRQQGAFAFSTTDEALRAEIVKAMRALPGRVASRIADDMTAPVKQA